MSTTTTETPEQRRQAAEIKRLGEEHARGGHTADRVGGCLACLLGGAVETEEKTPDHPWDINRAWVDPEGDSIPHCRAPGCGLTEDRHPHQGKVAP
jgi:hypothetical protein